jgi:hypothetical protein
MALRTRFAVAITVAALWLVAAPAAPAFGRDAPIRLNSHVSLARQFGYAPAYERNVPSFDAQNRPYIRSRTVAQDPARSVSRLRGGTFVRASLLTAVRRAYPRFVATVNGGGFVSEQVEVDAAGRLYTTLEIRLADHSLRNVLLYSMDGGRSWRLVTLPLRPRRTPYQTSSGAGVACEHLVGWNQRPGPPLIALWRPVQDWPGEFAARNELYIVQPRFEDGALVIPKPTLVSDRFLGMQLVAGGASFAATSGSTTFIVWAEVSPPGSPGAPTFVAAVDTQTGAVGAPTQVATARPANDDHDTPGICVDGAGMVHVITGSHNSAFWYTHSLAPLDVSGWSRPEQVLRSGYRTPTTDADGRGAQTYLSMVCTPDNALVIAYRQKRQGVDPAFSGRSYDPLSVQRLDPGGSWSPPRRVLFCTTHSGYTNYYQKLTIDRRGWLYLSLSYYRPDDWPRRDRRAHRYHHRMVLVSEDGGTTWRFARLADFVNGAAAPADAQQ